MQMLNSENVTSNAITGFKADIHKRWKEKSEEQKRRELVDELEDENNRFLTIGHYNTSWTQK